MTTTGNGCQGTDYPFLCDYVYRSLAQTPSLGATAEEREEPIKRGGLTVTTAIDPDTQDTVQDAVSNVVGPTDPLISAMDMIEPGTGLIVAMAQSRPVMGDNAKKGQTYWNYSVSPEMGGAQGFQAGSTFKAFTAAAALEQGIPLSKRYNARPSMDFSGASFESCAGPQQVSGSWRVRNSTGTNGVMDMYRAAERSVNTYFVQLALEVGMCDVVKMAEKLGVESSTDRCADQLLRRQAVLHPGHRRGEPAVGGRGVRHLRLRWHPLRPDHSRHHHRQQRREAPRRRARTANG